MRTLQEIMRREFEDWQRELPDAWKQALKDTQLDFDAFPRTPESGDVQAIPPVPKSEGTSNNAHTFKAFQALSPDRVVVAAFGNDPYPKPCHATGRAFEQGNLSDWSRDLICPGCVSRSLVSIVCAAVASTGKQKFLGLDNPQLRDRRTTLKQALDGSRNELLSPSTIFRSWEDQGVLLMNRALTFTDPSHQKYHRMFWKPFTDKVICVLVNEARNRPIVFALWGDKAKQLESLIQSKRKQLDVVAENIQIAKAGHPCLPHVYFRNGNPLAEVNRLIFQRGDGNQINWLGIPN